MTTIENPMSAIEMFVLLLPYIVPLFGICIWGLISMFFRNKADRTRIFNLETLRKEDKKDLEDHKNSTSIEFKLINTKMTEVEKSLVEIKTMLQILLGQKLNK